MQSQSLSANITIKKKYKTNKSDLVKKWWFLEHGEKSGVEQLKQKWEAITNTHQLETGISISI